MTLHFLLRADAAGASSEATLGADLPATEAEPAGVEGVDAGTEPVKERFAAAAFGEVRPQHTALRDVVPWTEVADALAKITHDARLRRVQLVLAALATYMTDLKEYQGSQYSLPGAASGAAPISWSCCRCP